MSLREMWATTIIERGRTGTMVRFFTSDTHFGDTRILRSAKRPFRTIGEHDAHIIRQWKATVGPDDEVWHLGDFAPGYAVEAVGALLNELPGRKHLITGNNDDAVTRTHPLWASVHDYHELVEDDAFCILCHYALRTWNKIGKGALDLHGHSHNMLKPLSRQYDVGVDAWNFTPVTLAAMRGGRRRWISEQRHREPLTDRKVQSRTQIAQSGPTRASASGRMAP